jgi:hypothetical protein
MCSQCVEDMTAARARGEKRVGVMETRDGRTYKATIAMSSDHAGIARELDRLEAELYRALAMMPDARTVKLYLEHLVAESKRHVR